MEAAVFDFKLSNNGGSAIHTIFLLLLCVILYIPYLGNTPVFDKGEPREALAVQDIVQRGEWLFPLKRATAIPSKPPLFIGPRRRPRKSPVVSMKRRFVSHRRFTRRSAPS